MTFLPTLPGSRSDAVIVKNASGTVLGKTMVHGTGLGPMLQFNPGTSKILYTPPANESVYGVAVDGSGTAYFSVGTYNPQLVKLTPGAATPQTLVSSSGLSGVVFVDGVGNVYYSDTQGIREIDADSGAITLVTNATARLAAVDIYGNLYALGGQTAPWTVQRFDRTTGVWTTIAGTTTGIAQGDGGLAVDAALSNPTAIAVDPSGDLYIAEVQGRIRKVDASTQIITTIAGNDTNGDTGDGGPASAAEVARCASIATDPLGNLYLASTQNFIVRKIDSSTGIISTVAGADQGASVETGELTNRVQIVFSVDDVLAVDSMGNLFSTDYWAPGVYEFGFQSPTLPFSAPGSGPNPSLVESLVNAGNQPLTVDSLTVAGPFALQTAPTATCGIPITLSPGSSCQTIVAYDASSSSQTGALTVTGNMSNVGISTQQAALLLLYPQAVLEQNYYSPFTGPLSFGSGVVGGFSGEQRVIVQNPTIANLVVTSVSFTGPGAASFSVDAFENGCVNAPVGPNSYCDVYVEFIPQATGVQNATMVLNANTAQPVTLAVTGTAVLPGVLSPSVSQVTFSLPPSGAVSAPQTITFLNTGGAYLSFTTPPQVVSTTINTISNSCASTYTLLPGASCSLTLEAVASSTPSTNGIYARYSNLVQSGIVLYIPVTTVVATGPAISNIRSTIIGGTSALITWTTDQPSTSQVNYGTSSSYGFSSPLDNTLVTSHSVTLTNLSAGATYDFDVVSSNSANGTTASPNATFTASPYVGYVAFWGVNSSGVTISWSTDAPATTFVAYGTTAALGQLSPVQTALSNSHGVVLSGLSPGTTYYFRAESTTAGGSTGASTLYSFTTAGTAASAAPNISNVTVTNITATSATISWTTDQAASSQVNYGTTTSYGFSSPLNSSLGTSHSVTLTGLTPGTTYDYDVISANSTGASSASPNGSFTTTSTNATPPYVGYVGFWGINNSGVTISWSTDVPANTQLAYGTSTALGQLTPLQTALSSSHGVVLTGLNAGTTYYFVAQSTGANGATGYSTTYSFTTSGTPSAAAPVISAVTAGSVTSGSAVITWTTDQASTSQVNYNNTSASVPGLVTAHSVTLSGLTPNTSYSFTVTSASASSMSTTSGSYNFTTSAASATPPLVANLGFWGITSSGVTMSWSTDVLANTSVAYGTTTALGSVSPVQTALTNSHGVTLTGLAPGTLYYFVAQSADASGNTGYSTTYSFTTLAGPPAISNVIAAPATGNTATISWTTSVPTYSYVQYGPSSGNYNRFSTETSLLEAPQCVLSYVPSGTVYYQLVSADAYGNQVVSPEATFVEP